jgi:hypothetical protein
MDRRNFLASSSAVGLATGSASAAEAGTEGNQIFELRCYKLRYSKADQYSRLTGFLESEQLPMAKRLGIVQGYFRVTLGEFTPRVYTLSVFDSLADMGEKLAARRADTAWSTAATEFGSHDAAPYDRVESWLLRAFDGMRSIEVPELPDKPRAFDLRIYEQETFRDTQEKMRMFNEEEIQIFRDCGIHPLFFGETIVGSHMPSLVYMSHYADMDARSKAWSTFGASEGWNRIKNRPGWGNADIVSTVSNIHLAGLPFSPIR